MNDYSTGTREDYFLSHIGLHQRDALRLEPSNLRDNSLNLDAAFQSFTTQATDTFSIATFTAAGFAGRLARMGFLSGSTSLPLQSFLSHAFGIGVEAASLEGIHRTFQNGNSEGASFLHNWALYCINFSSFKFVGSVGGNWNATAQHMLQSFAMFAGHQAASATGFEEKSQASISQQLFDANISNLHIRFGNTLGQSLQAGKLQRVERVLEARQQRVLASHAYSRNSSLTQEFPSFASHFSPKAGLEWTADRTDLYYRYLERLKPVDASSADHAHPILVETLGVKCKGSPYLERLLEVYAHSPLRGTEAQFDIATALSMTFRLRQAASSSGSFKGALIEEYVDVALEMPALSDRCRAMEALFASMERGLPPRDILPLFEGLKTRRYLPENIPGENSERFKGIFPPEGRVRARLAEAEYLPAHVDFLTRWVEYITGSNHAAATRILSALAGVMEHSYDPQKININDFLNFAQHHPLGLLILRRFLHVVASEDVDAKLLEISHALAWTSDTERSINMVHVLLRNNRSPEAVAQALSGKHHAAFLDDIRLGRKLVSVAMDAPLPEEIERQRRVNIEKAFHFIDTDLIPRLPHRAFALQDLLAFLDASGESQERKWLRHQHRTGNFRIQLVPANEFNSSIADCNLSFIDMQPKDGGLPLITLRQIDDLDPHDPLYRNQLHSQLVRRTRALIHEWEHWRHLSGNYAGIEAGGKAFQRGGSSRGNYLLIENLAHLEEERWGLLNDPYNMSRRLAHLMGINLPTYYRNLADHTHFLENNERLARMILE